MGEALAILTIETARRQGVVVIGDHRVELPEPRRHRVDLMPTIDRICRERGITPADIAQVHVCIGPGSFTGLRIGIATAQMLGLTLGAKLVGVPMIDAQVVQVPVGEEAHEQLAVCLNVKRDTVWAQRFVAKGACWQAMDDARLWRIDELLAQTPRPVALLIDTGSPEVDPRGCLPDPLPEGVRLMAPLERSAIGIGMRIAGRRLAEAGAFTRPHELRPIYAREPEAVTLWRAREGDGG